jgi:two-component system nitrate/nitrite response regulator NarL
VPGVLRPLNGSRPRIRVVIADGDPLARRVLREAFQADTRFAVVAEASDGIEAVELALHYRPEVLLIEHAMGRIDGIEATRRITSRTTDVRILFFAVRSCEPTQLSALRAGACGFLPKTAHIPDVIDAVRCTVRGEAVVSSRIAACLLDRLRALPSAGSGMRPVSSPLTPREWEVTDLLSAGRTPEMVADELGLAIHTVHSHLKNVMRKLGVHTRAGAIQAADQLCRGELLSAAL